MKMTYAGRILLLLVSMLIRVCPDANAQLSYAGYFKTRDGLPDVCEKLMHKAPLTVAFLGGSITYNPGWRQMVCKYLEDRWPGTRFRYIAAGIPSLGSLPHAFRLQQDVLDSGRVDLMFVEAAVNDRANGADSLTQVRALEGIVRHARRNNPEMDIVLMSFADPAKLEDYKTGKMPMEVHNHELVARHYALPSIDLAREVSDRIHAGEFSWEHDFKDVHPSPFGQRLYFETMRKMLDSIFKKAGRADGPARRQELPEPLDPDCFDNGSYLPVSAAKPRKGFRITERWRPSDSADVRDGFVNVPVLEATAPGAELLLPFAGTAVGMAVVSGPDAGIVEYSIDGGSFQSMDLYTKWSGQLHLPWYRLFAGSLSNGRHVLRIRIANSRDSHSKGTACRIVHFLVNRPVERLLVHQGVKYFISPKGDDRHTGTAAAPFRSISRAAAIAEPGDTIIVDDGIYRERVMPAHGGEEGRPIVYMAAHKHGAVVKGSDIWTPVWSGIGNGIYRAAVDTTLFTDGGYVDGGNPLRIAYSWNRPPYPYKKVSWTLGQIFLDGMPLKEVSSKNELRDRDSAWWYNNVAGSIEVHLENSAPAGRQVEITTRRGVFRPRQTGLGYIEVRGFVFEHCANQFPYRFWDKKYAANMQSGMVGTRGGHHWMITDNIIRYAKSIGLTIGASSFDNEIPSSTGRQDDCGYDVVTGNVFYANGSDAIMGLGHTGVNISGNIFVENNRLKNTTYEDGCIKTHFARDLLIEKNWFVNNETKGVWLDNTWTNCRITGNVFADNRGYDVFFELDNNTFTTPSMADHNIFLGGREGLIVAPEFEQATANAWDPWSCGIYSHDADGIIITHNLFAKEGYGIYSRDIPGRRGTASYRKVYGNIFAGKGMTSVSCPVEFPPYIVENHFYDNVYPTGPYPFVLHGYFGDPRPFPGALEKIQRLWKEHAGVGTDTSLHDWGPPGRPWGYSLTMDQWQRITGYDQDSRQMDIDCIPGLDKGQLMMNVPEDVPPDIGPVTGIMKGHNVLDLHLPDDRWFREYLQREYGSQTGERISGSRAWHIAVTGDDGNDGTAGHPFRTISKGAEAARPGDTVLVHAGVYRERVAPPRGGEAGKPITYMAAPGEKVYVRGSDVWKPDWKDVDGVHGVYAAGLGDVHFDNFNPYQTEISMFELMAGSSFYKRALNHQHDAANNTSRDIKVHATEKYTLGQVFVNGKMLTEMLNRKEVLHKKGSWAYIKEERSLVVNFPEGVSPGKALVELTTRNRIFAPHLRGLGYIRVKGFVFEHCANDAICLPHMVKDHPELATGQQGAVSTRSGHHWVIENNVIRLTKTVGMDVGSESTGPTIKDYEAVSYPAPPRGTEGFHLIKNNTVSGNGIAGIVGIVLRNTRILDNTVERNNLLLYTGQQHAGIKVLLCDHCEVSGNLVRDNECFGIWLDNQVDHAIVRDNVVLNNTRAGIFYEIGKGPALIEHNVVGNTRRDIRFPFGPGILLSDARGVTVRDNTLFHNDDVGLRIRLIPGRKSSFPTRSGFTEARDIVIARNRFYENAGGLIEMPYKGSLAGDIRIDSNSFSGKDVFCLSASGEAEAIAGKDDEGQKEKMRMEYRKLFRKDAVVTDSSKSGFRWSMGLPLAEWRIMTGEDGSSELRTEALPEDIETLSNLKK